MSEAGALMDRVYRRQRHIYDLTRKYYLLGRDGLIAELAPPKGGSVLEIACGTGRNLIKIARRYPDANCFGLDVSAQMLETARGMLANCHLDARIALGLADATSFRPAALFGREQFDRIVISYALSMIPNWQAALAHAASLLAPNGSLHIVDFGTGAGLPASFNTGLRIWLARFHVNPREGLHAEIERISSDAGLRPNVRERFGGYAVSARLDKV